MDDQLNQDTTVIQRRSIAWVRPGWLLGGAASLLGVICLTVGLDGQRGGVFRESRDHPAIRYTDGTTTDEVTRLAESLAAGTTTLDFTERTGYLSALLQALKIPIESQVTVFSDTSFQADQIDPENPRAIYFNDTVAVGWVRGTDVLEIAALDPTQGVLFFSLPQEPSAPPEITRTEVCLACHLSWDTLGVPGLMTINTLPMPDDPNAYAVGWTTDHRTPLAERWGSWYVTGAPEAIRHLGNSTEPIDYVPGDVPPAPPVLDTLDGLFDLDGFLTPYSDIVALMVLEHRNHMSNLLVRIGWEARVLAHQAGAARSGDSGIDLEDTAEELVDYLLFVDEAPLPVPITGGSGYAERYSALGPFDSQDRSLHQLDLKQRLLKYPASPLIYAEAFDALPAPARDAIYRRMWTVLSGAAPEPRYQRLSRDNRQAIVEILRDTKPGLPEYFGGTVG